MFNVGPIITKLLLENDCVVVPGFGGFVAQYSPAKLDESTGFFSPPSKQVLFNKNLINNDGLLVNEIGQFKKLNYKQANDLVKQKVKLLNLELKEKKQVNIKELGLIYLKNDIIKFKQNSENILSDSYGLTALNIREFKQEEIFNSSKIIPIQPIQSTNAGKWWVAAAIVPIIFYSAWLPLKTNLFTKNETFHYSDLNPFTFTKEKESFPQNLFDIKSLEQIKKEDFHLSQKNISPSKQLNNLENTNKAVNTAVEKSVVLTKATQRFHLIVGCFSSKKNANNLIKKLKKSGENALELDIHKNLHRVSIASFSSKKEAIKYKKQLKKNYSISSWILKK